MVYLETMEDWQRQATLLFQARPATARITTKYNIPNLDSEKYASKKRKRAPADTEEKAEADAPRVPRATLEVKAYDPESGVTLKFKTEKSADVGRLFAGLGRVGRQMAALPENAEAPEDVVMDNAPAGEGADSKDQAAPEVSKPTPNAAGGGGSGGKKKKKGKK